jgi:cyclic pyranopterin monophosphate synthase
MSSFTHLDESNNPSMVDVGNKATTRRTARAQAIVVLGAAIMDKLEGNDIQTKKGPVFQTAILAGIMAAKQTSNLIPLCHPLALEKVGVEITVNAAREVVITCTARLTGKTGVEMEALTGASVAALTIYDMCKAFSHDIVIREVRLLEKTGGKSDYKTS